MTQGVIEFACPRCKRVTRVPRELGGKQARCPGCKKVFEIPRAPDAPPKKPEEKPAADVEIATGTVSAPEATSKTGKNAVSLLRQLPPLLIVGLVASAIFPLGGGAVCAFYVLRPTNPQAKNWAYVGLMLAVATTMVHFALWETVAADAAQRPGGVQGWSPSPGTGG